jgi:creatinine amidohydrolase
MEFADLTWPRAGALLRASRRPVLLLPVGAVEPHGPHAPLGTDLLISLGVCRRAAERLRDDPEVCALVLPPLPYGVTRYASAFPGAVSIGEETLQALLADLCASLIAQGFRWIMLVNSHFEPEHVQTLHRAADTVQARTGAVVGFLDLTRRERAQALTEEFRRAECHAGQYETSMVLADRPDLVDAAAAAKLPYVPVSLAKAIGAGLRDFKAMGLADAYNGSPARATPQEGRDTYERITAMLVDLVRELARGTGGRDRPGAFGRKPGGGP